MTRIAVLTGTRAEYGLLYWIIKTIHDDPNLELQLIVTGTHLSPEYGLTVKEIEKSGIPIAEKIDMILSTDSEQGIAKSMGVLMISLAQSLERLRPDILLILGDRYEVLAAASTAVAMNIPIAHLCGGESTEGAIDEQIRHAVTKLSHIHFAQSEFYRQRIIKMGEEEWRVHNIGIIAFENIKRLPLLSKTQLEKELGIKLDNTNFVVTYHPVTLENDSLEYQIDNLLNALSRFKANIIFTYPNADSGGRLIIDKIKQFQTHHQNAHVYFSLGQIRYLSLLKYSDVMIGNSSSGILESPFFKLPTVNIGNRQKGRMRPPNVVDVSYNEDDIVEGINKALNKEFRNSLNNKINIYGSGDCSSQVVKIIKEALLNKNLLKKKLSFK
ncbi:UDP-N-acetylglucosamine 2-epimerase [Caloranaerobacter ferrireducens]|uniref:UDP-N-acetylglucosamine 2-epimerase n=1 Tax=Caloranaerobacter ferrireducens TaxID=1323370 RepID=UPI00084D0EB2|nr:UDP-N-acetylglucosamine 2-epimerase [Caloranaerobacter ferrireducens]